MDLEPRESALVRLRRRAEITLYRVFRPMGRQRAVRLRTTAATLVVVTGLAGAGGYWLAEARPESPSGMPPGAREAPVRSSQELPLKERLAQDAKLQTYLDEMGMFLIEKDLRDAGRDSEVRMLARTRTLTALEELDPAHKTQVVRFLSAEASLVQSAPGADPIISLMGADLSGIDLSDEAPGGAEPYAAPPARDPSHEAPGDAEPSDAGVPVLDLSGADLTYADLRGADLDGVIMDGTRLVGTDLRGADLDSTMLHDANLSGANLSGATGTTGEQLEKQSSSLEGAIMPNGQKYEDWLNGKGGGEGQHDSDPS